MAIRFRQPTEEEKASAGLSDRLGDFGAPGVLTIAECDADHCTPEERAVIDASLRLRQTETAHWVEKEVGSDPSRTSRERGTACIKFIDACDALLAARGKEK